MSVQTQVQADSVGTVSGVGRSNTQNAAKSKGLEFRRKYTRPGINPLDVIQYASRSCVITNPDGTVVFELRGLQVPEGW